MRLKTSILKTVVMSLFVSAAGAAQATTVAIIDSGVDYKHEVLASKMWENPNDSTTDADGVKYKNDKHGWNFADSNNQIIDYKYQGTFSRDCYKIFEVQGKILRGTATDADKEWYKAKRSDANFIKELSKFGNYIHGTHVAGISSDGTDAGDLVGMKLIATEPPGSLIAASYDKAGNPMVSMMLGMLAKRQAELLIKVGKYTKAVGSKVANGSFGASVNAVKPAVIQLVKQLTGSEPTDAEATQYAIELINSILKESKGFVDAAPENLFVFAAGNDGTNNDELPVSPANIKTDNTISVAATMGTEKLASFSNYGAKMVDVAAPGVTIRASIPGNEYLELSGTSMAAPYVTNVASRVREANRALSPANVKKILIETVDKKDWLTGKVKAGGIVNMDRAVAAARLSNGMSLDLAIAQSYSQVDREAVEELNISPEVEDQLIVLPMQTLIQ